MKKNLSWAIVVAVFCAFGAPFHVFAQGGVLAADSNSSSENDRQLAETIERLSSRSTDGLKSQKLANGGTLTDLDNRFQSVMLAKQNPNGELAAACVTSVGEANAFLGRNLETGENIAPFDFQSESLPSVAARHGMSVDEFEFYRYLIANAERNRARYPDAATLNIVNNDGAGEGFNDPAARTPEGNNTGTTLGAQRLNLFNFAAGIWGAFLDSSVPINVGSQFNPLTPCSASGGVLGSAGTSAVASNFPNAQLPGTNYHFALANKQAGVDLGNGSIPSQINATFNSSVDTGCLGAGSRFYYGLNNTTPGGTVNLLIVLLHEMGHGLGFSTFTNGSTGQFPLISGTRLPDVYSTYMFDRSVSLYWNAMTDAQRQASAINPNNVLWDGANVRVASGGLTAGREASTGRIELFTPNPLQQGSSVSHFTNAATPNLLMEPAINTGLPLTLDLTRQQTRDIGWYRDTTANLIPDTITNVQPGGSRIVPGSSVTVTWTNNGGFNRNVTIELSTDGGRTYPTVIATDVVNTGSFTFTAPAVSTTQARIRVREHNFVAPAGISAGNPQYDFDGDGKADQSVFRNSDRVWYVLRSQNNSFTAAQFGFATDRIAPADFDGDGRADIATFRDNTWFWLNSSNGAFNSVQFGQAGDIPVPADYTGDGRAELAVFRPSSGVWFTFNLTNSAFAAAQFGQNGDIPVPADFDGDARTDLATYRAGVWFHLRSSDSGFRAVQFGVSTDKPVVGDYDADGRADYAVYRNGTWFVQGTTTSYFGVQFGQSGDVPVPADYDGDGAFELAVFRNGTWFTLNPATSQFRSVQWGVTNDRPVPAAYIP